MPEKKEKLDPFDIETDTGGESLERGGSLKKKGKKTDPEKAAISLLRKGGSREIRRALVWRSGARKKEERGARGRAAVP